MIVIVAGPYVGFPNGTAPTSRVTAYARGLAAAGEEVRVILLGPSELDEVTAVNTDVIGVHRGIPFEYTSVSTVKSRSLLTRRWRAWSSLFAARRRIRALAAEHTVDTILLYSTSVSIASLFRSVSRAVGATYAVDLCEMPGYDLPPGAARDRMQDRYGRRFVRRFDLVIAISSRLAEYATRYLRPGAEVVVVPVMVDCDEYAQDRPPVTDPRLITYAGLLNDSKDGIGDLMTAFARVAEHVPDVVLRLVGDTEYASASTIPLYRELAYELGIADRVDFTGLVPRREIPRYLAEASVLVLARPLNHQTDAGLPTKVGEYLAAGRPVVVTRTSDIAEYVRDGESAYLVPSDDTDALAAKLRQVLGDPDAAMRVGSVGRRVARERFDYRVTGRALVEALRRHRQDNGRTA